GVFVHQLIAPHDRERAGKKIAEILHGKKSRGNEYTAQRKDGTTFPVMIYSSPIIKKGKPVGLRGIVVDITEFKQGEEEKAKLEARIRQAEKMEAMGNLAGGVAHDLNNILSSVTGFPELILLDLTEDSPLRGPLQVIKDSGEKAAQVVQDLLTLARRGVSVEDVVNANDIISDLLRSPEYGKLKW
ncbi:MAG: PAS domain S-box protein, partial [Deltaproteobacteria bacterium]|nr:PAS domain S-box protein [Deltaproteobacteria bacterium]